MEEECVVTKFEGFDVYKIENGYSFIYANFHDVDLLIEGLIDYIFDEDNLLNYATRISKIKFKGEIRQYARLYHNISLFLNEKLEKIDIKDVNEELYKVLEEEYSLISENGILKVQNDKIGKIGEYIFHLLLTNYFELDCIFPKLRLITDRNMSVFGIDTLFLNTKNKEIYFGESKFCKSLENGIKLINVSLKDYEIQISEEYRLLLTSDDALKLSNEFIDLFGGLNQICLSFDEFVKKANIKSIGIPIFVAHGNEEDENTPKSYIDKMSKRIKTKNLFGLENKYIFISLPVIDKNKFVEKAIKKVVKKQNEYKQYVQ